MFLFFFLIEWNQLFGNYFSNIFQKLLLFGNYFSNIFLIQDPLRKQVVYFSIINFVHTYLFLFSVLLSTTLVFFIFWGESVRHCNFSVLPYK